MTPANDAWRARHRARWLRPDAHLYLRPDAHRFMRPDAKRFLRQDWKRFVQPAFVPVFLSLLEGKANFNPNQPRVPKGNPDGGQWTGEKSSGDSESLESGTGSDRLTDFGASRRSVPRFARPKGHHFVAKEIYRDLPLRPETRKVFDEATTGPLRAQRHGWSAEHRHYNQAVKEKLKKFMDDNGIDAESMTPRQARDFSDSIKRSHDPRIRDFNMRIYRRELQFLLRYGPRRLE